MRHTSDTLVGQIRHVCHKCHTSVTPIRHTCDHMWDTSDTHATQPRHKCDTHTHTPKSPCNTGSKHGNSKLARLNCSSNYYPCDNTSFTLLAAMSKHPQCVCRAVEPSILSLADEALAMSILPMAPNPEPQTWSPSVDTSDTHVRHQSHTSDKSETFGTNATPM